MNADERDIITYLRSWPRQYISATEICRRAAGKRRYREDQRWAIPILTRMVEQEVLESDALAHYRLRHVEEEKKQQRKPSRWIAPNVAKILKQSGKTFEILEEEAV